MFFYGAQGIWRQAGFFSFAAGVNKKQSEKYKFNSFHRRKKNGRSPNKAALDAPKPGCCAAKPRFWR